MMPIERKEAPEILIKKGPEWTAAFLERRKQDPHCPTYWPKVAGKPLSRVLLPDLEAMTAKHCAYCDHAHLGAAAQKTIDHFRPKSLRPDLAYNWENLFPACNVCQGSKLDRFDDSLLKPDDRDYSFERFFIYNFRTGEIEPRPDGSVEERNRAEVTIRILGLNVSPRAQARKHFYREYYTPRLWRRHRAKLEQLPYRFLAPPDDGQRGSPADLLSHR